MTAFFKRLALIVAACAALAACVTVNIYFPAAEVERTADQVVDEVYGIQDGETKPESGLRTFLAQALSALGPAEAHAADATSVSNAAIRGLKQQIKSNHQQLLPFYQGGNVGITNQGYLEVRSTDGLSVAQVGALKRLVKADNDARAQLYSEVARALNIDPSQKSRVESIFAQEWQKEAGSGWWVQSGGGWTRK